GALVGRPGYVALSDAQHDLAQRQREVRVGARAHAPHADDAQRRLVEGDRGLVRRLHRGLPALLRADALDAGADLGSVRFRTWFLQVSRRPGGEGRPEAPALPAGLEPPLLVE